MKTANVKGGSNLIACPAEGNNARTQSKGKSWEKSKSATVSIHYSYGSKSPFSYPPFSALFSKNFHKTVSFQIN